MLQVAPQLTLGLGREAERLALLVLLLLLVLMLLLALLVLLVLLELLEGEVKDGVDGLQELLQGLEPGRCEGKERVGAGRLAEGAS